MSGKLKVGGSSLSNDMDVKHASLMRDYLQLQQEFDTLKDQLSAAQARKTTVFAEVRFLRRRLKKLKESSSNIKDKHSASSTAFGEKTTSGAFAPEPASRSPNNNSLGTMEIPVFWEPPRTKYPDEVTKKKPVSGNVELLSALKTSELRNRSNMFATALPGKRKISWQDQISLQCN